MFSHVRPTPRTVPTYAKTEQLDLADQPQESCSLAPAAYVQGKRTPACAPSRATRQG